MKSSASSENVASRKADAKVESNANYSSEEKGQINEYAALMTAKGGKKAAGSGDVMEDMLFGDASGAGNKGKSAGCVVC